ncbi:MAG: hypothetical protein IJY38_03340 [Clostridia bacterium]|nr:hypothetical protein [Clostridia bacterium]
MLEIDGTKERAADLLKSAAEMGVSSVKLYPAYLELAKNLLKSSPVLIDCKVGGAGKTLKKVKVYETKIALRAGAKEITLVLDDDLLLKENTDELKREIKSVKRAFKNGTVKLYTSLTDKTVLFRLAKLAACLGVWFISVPYEANLLSFQEELHGVCFVEFRGVTESILFKELLERGIIRIAVNDVKSLEKELIEKLPPLESGFTRKKNVPPSAMIPTLLFENADEKY